jgi:poly-gamma-glutamate synthesis protein (capsule biosynthesis protein)
MNRTRFPHQTFCLLTLIAAAALSARCPAADEVTLAFAGDVMLADLPGESIAAGRDPLSEFADIFSQVDVAVANLECVVSTVGEAVEKPYTFRAHPRVLDVVGRHFGVVSLANNHTGDFGHDAFLEQLALLDNAGIGRFGGGRDCREARRPLLLDRHGLRIALLGYNDFHPREFEAGPSWPGVAWAVDEQVVADIKAARSAHKADLVIPFLHWGEEYDPANDRQRALARLLIDSGADVVVGGHPHVTQEVEYYQGKLIVYSVGNCVFDGFDPGPSRQGWILRLRVDKLGLVAWDTVPLQIDDEGTPHLDRERASPGGRRGDERFTMRPARLETP